MYALSIIMRSPLAKAATHVGAAVLLLAACSQIVVPMYPVPWTLQTFGLTIVAFMMPPRQSFFSTLLWITLGVVGFPLFAFCSGGPGVLLGATGGYVLGFLVAAPVMSFLKSLVWSFTSKMLIGIAGGVIILFFGWLQLAFLLSSSRKAFLAGVFPFIVSDLMKVFLAVSLATILSKKKDIPLFNNFSKF